MAKLVPSIEQLKWLNQFPPLDKIAQPDTSIEQNSSTRFLHLSKLFNHFPPLNKMAQVVPSIEQMAQLVSSIPGHITQSVTCLAKDAYLTADPGVASSILVRSILSWRLIISKVILLPSTESFKKGCCQLQAKVCARNTG